MIRRSFKDPKIVERQAPTTPTDLAGILIHEVLPNAPKELVKAVLSNYIPDYIEDMDLEDNIAQLSMEEVEDIIKDLSVV